MAKITLNKEQKEFSPITLEIKVVIETEQEYQNLIREFTEGNLAYTLETDYDTILPIVLNDIQNAILND